METELHQLTLLESLLSMGPGALLLLLLEVGTVGRSLLRPPHPSVTRRTILMLLPILLTCLLTLHILHMLHSQIGISGIDSSGIDYDLSMRMALWDARTLLASGLLTSFLTLFFTTLRLRAATPSPTS